MKNISDGVFSKNIFNGRNKSLNIFKNGSITDISQCVADLRHLTLLRDFDRGFFGFAKYSRNAFFTNTWDKKYMIGVLEDKKR